MSPPQDFCLEINQYSTFFQGKCCRRHGHASTSVNLSTRGIILPSNPSSIRPCQCGREGGQPPGYPKTLKGLTVWYTVGSPSYPKTVWYTVGSPSYPNTLKGLTVWYTVGPPSYPNTLKGLTVCTQWGSQHP